MTPALYASALALKKQLRLAGYRRCAASLEVGIEYGGLPLLRSGEGDLLTIRGALPAEAPAGSLVAIDQRTGVLVATETEVHQHRPERRAPTSSMRNRTIRMPDALVDDLERHHPRKDLSAIVRDICDLHLKAAGVRS